MKKLCKYEVFEPVTDVMGSFYCPVEFPVLYGIDTSISPTKPYKFLCTDAIICDIFRGMF